MERKIIIGTRGSDLALWQANYTKELLEDKGHQVEIKIISTQGDRSQQWNTSFDKLEGKGFFTKENVYIKYFMTQSQISNVIYIKTTEHLNNLDQYLVNIYFLYNRLFYS